MIADPKRLETEMMRCIVALALLIATPATPAGAEYFLRWPNGLVTYLPDEMILLAVLIGALACFWLLYSTVDGSSSSSSITRMSVDLPDEMRKPESVEYYDDMTERTRALKRKLDADTELAESYISASRARAELEEIDEREAALGRRLSQHINERR